MSTAVTPLEPLALEYGDPTSYFYSKHGRIPASLEERNGAHAEYAQAIRDKFIDEWCPRYGIQEHIEDPLKSNQELWKDYSTLIASQWQDEKGMLDCFKTFLRIELKPVEATMSDELKKSFATVFGSAHVGESMQYVYQRLNSMAAEWAIDNSWYRARMRRKLTWLPLENVKKNCNRNAEDVNVYAIN